MKVCVIGAGPAGLSAAYQLARAGIEVAVVEASSEVGGMSRSFSLWDQTVDLGPHRFFSSDRQVNQLWLELAQRDYSMVDRLTRVFYGNRMFRYPLEPVDAMWKLGPRKAVQCAASYLRERIRPTCELDGSFEAWVVRRFGRHLFETFFQSYSEKLWGISCRDLDADFAAQRIKKLTLGQVIKAALGGARGKHRTLVDRFAYPHGGTGMIYERMADGIRAVGELHTSTAVRRVIHTDRHVTGVELTSGRTLNCDHVISTMPLTHLVDGLNESDDVKHAASALQFRNTVLVYLLVDGTDLFPDQWIYVQDPRLDVGRITNFRNWIPQLYGDSRHTILSLEYWCYDSDERWKSADATLIDAAEREVIATGLLGDAPVVAGHVCRVPRCYPVYRRGYRDSVGVIRRALERYQGLTAIGRYGAFKYNNQDHSILMGIRAAEQILSKKDQGLWEINTDYETYQEAAVIGESGLEPVAD